jgi:ATP-dependent helicase/nuclease subunit A
MATAAAHDQLTSQQANAVQRREASIVLSSGAGCGKTHVLTRRYLSHLLHDGAEVGQVVAITFTDRAAREMRDRIRRAILAHLDAAVSDADVQRWEKHLRDLEAAQISTIHAFCAALLRQHALEARLDPAFEVLEDYLAVNLETEALTDSLQKLLTAQTQTGEDLRQLVLLYGWKPTLTAVQHLMRQRDAAAQLAWSQREPLAIAQEWRDYARQVLLPRYIQYLTAASPAIASCLWLLSTTPCRGQRMQVNLALLLEKTPRLAEAADLAAAIKELTEAAKVGPERAKAWLSEEVYETIKGTFERFRKELPARLEWLLDDPGDLVVAIAAGQRLVRVAEEASQAYRQLKHRHGVLDFQDLLVQARDLLRDTADVRERLQRRFRFVLIDEFQDTDPVQMDLVELLVGAGLTLGKLFAVGDHAQSIYRFRGANVQLFQHLRRRMPHEGRLDLTRNFRSQPALLHFTNALVGSRFAGANPRWQQTGLEDYVPLEANRPQLNPGPCVEFLWSPREEKDLATQARTQEADWIARRIAAMVRNREKLIAEKSELRPVKAGDVVLLFRAMTNVELYEAALRHYGLDYYLVGGRAFFAQQEIYDLLNLLRALENPQDAVSLAGTLRSPFCCLSDETLYKLARHPEGLWNGLHDQLTHAALTAEQRERVERVGRYLKQWRALKDRLPIAGLLNRVFAESGYDAATQFEFLGDRKLANLWKLIDLARTFDRSGLFGLAEFIARLGDLVRSQPREEQAATQPENADVVRLMTIHQAKGLEFPVVFLPDVASTGGGSHLPVAHWDARLGCIVRPPNEEPPPVGDFGWKLWQASEAVEEWREDLRTLYVACTRAEDYLVLSAALKPDLRPEGSWMRLLAERFDLHTGRCLVTELAPEQVPQIRVTDALRPPPAASPPPAQAPLKPKGTGVPAQSVVLANPPAPYIITMNELQCLLDGLPIELAAATWDVEDESDLHDWRPPREHVDPVSLDAEARDWIAGQLAQLEPTAVCHREIEFLFPLPTDVPGIGSVVIRGIIDLLWQDPTGSWHLAWFHPERLPADTPASDWQRRLAATTVAALAVKSQRGRFPRTVSRHYHLEKVAIQRSGTRLPVHKVLEEICRALAAAAHLPAWRSPQTNSTTLPFNSGKVGTHDDTAGT